MALLCTASQTATFLFGDGEASVTQVSGPEEYFRKATFQKNYPRDVILGDAINRHHLEIFPFNNQDVVEHLSAHLRAVLSEDQLEIFINFARLQVLVEVGLHLHDVVIKAGQGSLQVIGSIQECLIGRLDALDTILVSLVNNEGKRGRHQVLQFLHISLDVSHLPGDDLEMVAGVQLQSLEILNDLRLRVTEVLNEVNILKDKQEDMDSKLNSMKKENETLWREVITLRQKHSNQQKIVNKLIHFLMSYLQTRMQPRYVILRLEIIMIVILN